ncbi:hypothetical protein [Couchioplanes caeruleus]|uniref:hypothetical protein n=2 Tax=Couchioplanes caeruleus TaxID=56438 RepID=UPI0011CE8D07|nr:hypothetical protein [Couchioplanes caeruleus]
MRVLSNKITNGFLHNDPYVVRPRSLDTADVFAGILVYASRVAVTGNSSTGTGSAYTGIDVDDGPLSDLTVTGNVVVNGRSAPAACRRPRWRPRRSCAIAAAKHPDADRQRLRRRPGRLPGGRDHGGRQRPPGSVTWVNASTLRVLTPAGTPGTRPVVALSRGGVAAAPVKAPGRYAAGITCLKPSSVALSGGPVTVTASAGATAPAGG